jgi:hypothetical protein
MRKKIVIRTSPKDRQHALANGRAKTKRRRADADAAEGRAAAERAHRPTQPASLLHARHPHARVLHQAHEWRAARRGGMWRINQLTRSAFLTRFSAIAPATA